MHNRYLRLAKLAAANDNVLTRGQLNRIGFSDERIKTFIRNKLWQQIQRGVFLLGAPAPTWRQRARASCLAAGPASALGADSAVLWWGLDGAAESDTVSIAVSNGCGPRPRGVRVRRTTRNVRTRMRGGVRVTEVDDTLLDFAAVAKQRRDVELAVESALRRRLTTERRIWQTIARNSRSGVRGVALLRDVMAHRPKGKPARSYLEVEVLDLIRAAKLPLPTRNHDVIDGDGNKREIDLCYVDELGAIEADGDAFHSTATQTADDERRQAALEAVGFRFVRVTWRDAFDRPDWVVKEIRKILCAVVVG